MNLPGWVQAITAAAALVIALGILWQKVIHPGFRFARTVEELVPLLVELTDAFRDTPHAFAVLDQIVAQFRTDSGSSLRDVVDRLEKGAHELEVNAEVVRRLAVDDREKLATLIRLLDRVDFTTSTTGDTAHRIERATTDLGFQETDRETVDRIEEAVTDAEIPDDPEPGS